MHGPLTPLRYVYAGCGFAVQWKTLARHAFTSSTVLPTVTQHRMSSDESKLARHRLANYQP